MKNENARALNSPLDEASFNKDFRKFYLNKTLLSPGKNLSILYTFILLISQSGTQRNVNRDRYKTNFLQKANDFSVTR